MDPYIWGPSAWEFLHSTTFAYPDEPSQTDKLRYKDFFEQLCYVLPCKDCCLHYQQELVNTKLDQALDSRDTLSRWMVEVHNNVNKRLGKTIVPYETVRKKYISYTGSMGRVSYEWYSTSWKRLFLYTCVLSGSCYLTYRLTKK